MTKEDKLDILETLNANDEVSVYLQGPAGLFTVKGGVWMKENGDYMVGDTAIFSQTDRNYPGGHVDKIRDIYIMKRWTNE
jgi:hypothetical protein